MEAITLKIFIDADACPVQNEVITLAKTYNKEVIIVKSFSHFSHEELPDFVETVYVDKGAEMADMKIMQLTTKNDIVITQDYGLAALCMGKGCRVLHHKGFEYTTENIDRLLTMRHAGQMARKAGQKTKGPKALTEKDKGKFKELLAHFLNNSNF